MIHLSTTQHNKKILPNNFSPQERTTAIIEPKPAQETQLGAVVIPSHDPNVIFSLANNRTSVIVFY
jgi:hypothetical protein